MKRVMMVVAFASLVGGCAGRTPAPGSGLTNAVVNETILKHRAEIRACYDKLLQKRPGLKGKLVVAFRVEATGALGALSVREDQIGDSGFVGCLSDRLVAMAFPPAPVHTDVPAYPFFLNTPTALK